MCLKESRDSSGIPSRILCEYSYDSLGAWYLRNNILDMLKGENWKHLVNFDWHCRVEDSLYIVGGTFVRVVPHKVVFEECREESKYECLSRAARSEYVFSWRRKLGNKFVSLLFKGQVCGRSESILFDPWIFRVLFAKRANSGIKCCQSTLDDQCCSGLERTWISGRHSRSFVSNNEG